MSRAAKAMKLMLVATAAFTGLAGVAAALAVKQVPAGHRLEIDGQVHDSGLVIAPLWTQARLLSPVDLPAIEMPKAPPVEYPRNALQVRLDAARTAVTTAEEAAVEQARVTGSEFADLEKAHLAGIAEMQIETEGRIATLRATAEQTPVRRAAEAEAEATVVLAEARAAVARAEAHRARALGAALSGEAGRYAIAIDAARNFQLGDIHLPNPPPDFLQRMGSMDAWRLFFLGRP